MQLFKIQGQAIAVELVGTDPMRVRATYEDVNGAPIARSEGDPAGVSVDIGQAVTDYLEALFHGAGFGS